MFTAMAVALFSATLAGCWAYSRPDPTTDCQKISYGVAVAATSTENCEPAPQASATPSPMIHPMPPPLPSPGML